MPSINQIIAEIQEDMDLVDAHKLKVVRIIREAEKRIAARTPASAPRNIKNAKGLVQLGEWEDLHGKLCTNMMPDWIKQCGLCPIMVQKAIIEFREEMLAKGKTYADFARAFQTYLRKGYLSKKLADCTIARSPFSQQVVLDTKEVRL
jgi:hypothetical protein